MKKLYGSFAAKLIAVILLCLLVLAFVGSAISAMLLYQWDAYTDSQESFRKFMVADRAESIVHDTGYIYRESGEGYVSDPNLRCTVLNGAGDVLWTNYEDEDVIWQTTERIPPNYNLEYVEGNSASYYDGDDMPVPYEDFEVVTPTPAPTPYPTSESDADLPLPTAAPSLTPPTAPRWNVSEFGSGEWHSFHSREEMDAWVAEKTLTVKGYVVKDMEPRGDLWQRANLASFLYTGRFAVLWIAGLSFLFGVLLFLFLLRAAGHRKNTEEIVPSFVEKIPFDVFTVLVIAAIAVFMTPLMGGFDWPEILFALIPCILLIGLSFLLWCMSFAVRVKLGTLWSGCLIVRFCRWLWKGLTTMVRHLPILWKWALGLAGAAFIDLIFRMNAVWSENRATFFWFLFWLLAAAATLYAVLAFRRLRLGAKEIASGNLSSTVEEKNLILDFKDHAHDLNHIRDGLNEALEKRLQSERFRTELITNVSHDIKTPLTSIVNYVDLLQKEEPKTEKQQEYLEVLSRQSGKLKKLIEDLIEASKASSGALAVDLQPCDLSVLLDQTAGEYAERLEKAQLELVLQKPDTPVTVMADGRHLWRVFDNLMNNIVKYALPGTRVYLRLQESGGTAEVSFRNISREPLTMDARELTERFVRGDASRHTEGNGLGLAIAMSLMRLQKGEMDISLDGDLFKVTLRFPKA